MKRTGEIIAMRYSGKIGARAIGSSDSISAAAATAIERALDAGVVTPSEVEFYKGEHDGRPAVTSRRTRAKR